MGILSGWKSKRKGEEDEGDVGAEDPTPAAVEERPPVAIRPEHEPPPRPHTPPPPSPPTRSFASLRDDLIALGDRHLPRLEFANAVVARLVQSPTVAAAALLAYHPRDNRLDVIAGSGISEAASRVLSGEVTGEGGGRWDIPLRGLLARRINVIEAANENPFVPEPLKEVSPRRLTIVTIPFYQGPNPVGAALIFVPLEKGLSDLRLQQLTQAVRVCSAAFVDETSSNALPPAVAAPAARPSAAAPARRRLPALLGEELGRLKEAIEEAERQRAAEAAERVTAETFLRAERDKGAALERDLVAVRAELEALRESAQAAAVAHAGESAAREALAQAETEKTAAREQLAAAEQKAVAAARTIEELTRARYGLQTELAEARADAVARGEEARSLVDLRAQGHALTREIASLRSELAAAEAARRQAEKEARGYAAEVASARAALERSVEEGNESRAALERELGEERGRRQSAEQETEGQRAALALSREESERAILAVRESAAKEAIARRAAEDGAAELSERLVALEEGRGSLADRVASLSQAEEERARLAALVPGLERSLGEARAAIARLERERDERLGHADRTLAEERAGRSAAEGELERMHRALDDERRNAFAATEALRRESAREVASVRAELSAEIEERMRLEPELGRLRAAAESAALELERERDARRELGATLERDREAHRLTAKAADEAIAAVHGQRDEALARLAAIEHEARAGSEAALSVRAELESAMRARLDLETAIAARERHWAEERTQAERTRVEAVEQLRLAGAETDRRLADAEAARRALEERTAVAQAEHERIIAEWEARFARAETEFQARVEELEGLQQELEQAYEGELGRLRLELEGGEVGQGESYALERLVGADGDADLAIERSSEPRDHTSDPLPEPEPAPPPPPRPGIFFLDDAPAARAAATALDEPERRALAVAGDAKGLAALAAQPDAVLVVNLAAPNVLGAIRALRSSDPSSKRRVYGYALAPGAAKGFWVGAVDFALVPFVAGVDLASTIRRNSPGAKRVLAMSGDIDLMGDVRSRLAAAKMSTAVVFDGRQALDLVPTVRPEAAILHLTPISADVFSAVLGFRSAENARHIPLLFLIDVAPHAREEGFVSAGLRLLGGRPNFDAVELAACLASTASA